MENLQTNENTGGVRSWYSIRSEGGKHGAARQRADELGVVAVNVLGEVKRLVSRVMQIDICVVRKDVLDEPKGILGLGPCRSRRTPARNAARFLLLEGERPGAAS